MDTLGLFNTIPREIRNQIWDEVACLIKSPFPTSSERASALLRTCMQMHAEAM